VAAQGPREKNLAAALEREDLNLPDRFEALRGASGDALRAIVHPVEPSLETLGDRFSEMQAARRGGLMILRGQTGVGKSTFLDTAGFFWEGVVTERVPRNAEIPGMLEALGSADGPRLVVLEGREALGSESAVGIEAALHAVNEFVRSAMGTNTLIVWPTNTDDLTDLLTDVGGRLGAEALFGVGNPVEHFTGPPEDAFVEIAEQTVQTLNSGASLAALGISEGHALEMAAKATTIGNYMALVRQALLANEGLVEGLMQVERYRLWTLVIAGNEPENDVAAVTRGSHSYVDIDRLLSATNANVVKELKSSPEQVGLLATNLDARILHMDMVTALGIAREFGDDSLHEQMREKNMVTTPSAGKSAASRLQASELGVLLAADTLGPRKRGSGPGGGTKDAFRSLAQIASKDDGAINRAIGRGLVETGLVEDYGPEVDLGTELNYASDLLLRRAGEPIRLEIMWRSKTSRAEIANYVLVKLRNYGRAIGYID
jgi:hypothetical protein